MNRTVGYKGLSALGVVFLLAGCAKDPDVDPAASSAASASATKDEKKSGGWLSSVFGGTKPVAIPEGTEIAITLEQAVASDKNQTGDSFAGSVAAPISVEGKLVVPKGAPVRGHLVEVKESARLKGVAHLKLVLDAVEVEGKEYEVQTSTVTRTGGSHAKRNTVLIGGGAATGAVIGGVVGGGKGALIGGAVGAGAGTAGAAATGKKDITLGPEAPLSFRLAQAVTVQVKE